MRSVWTLGTRVVLAFRIPARLTASKHSACILLGDFPASATRPAETPWETSTACCATRAPSATSSLPAASKSMATTTRSADWKRPQAFWVSVMPVLCLRTARSMRGLIRGRLRAARTLAIWWRVLLGSVSMLDSGGTIRVCRRSKCCSGRIGRLLLLSSEGVWGGVRVVGC